MISPFTTTYRKAFAAVDLILVFIIVILMLKSLHDLLILKHKSL